MPADPRAIVASGGALEPLRRRGNRAPRRTRLRPLLRRFRHPLRLGDGARGRGGARARARVRAPEPGRPRARAADPLERRAREAAHRLRRRVAARRRPGRQHVDPRARRARRARAARRADRARRRCRAATSSPACCDAAVVDGTTWALPWYVDTRLLFYRTDLFAAAGVGAPPRTWGELAATRSRRCARRADRTGTRSCCRSREWEPLVILALQRGATLLRDGDRYGDFREPRVPRRVRLLPRRSSRDGLAPARGAAAVANLYQDFAAGWLRVRTSPGPWNLGEFAPPAARRARRRMGDGADAGARRRRAGRVARGRREPRDRRAARRARTPRGSWSSTSRSRRSSCAFYALTGDLPARRSRVERRAALARRRAARRPSARSSSACARRRRCPEWERIAARDHAPRRGARSAATSTPDEALAALDRDVDRILEKRRWMPRATRSRR